MEVCFWGVRGSIPAPPTTADLQKKLLRVLELASGKDISSNESRLALLNSLPERDTTFLGGNTPCVELRVGNKILIFDMGTGLRELGDHLIKTGKTQRDLELHVFISHTHWDHMQGFPFFVPAYRPNVTVHFYFAHPQFKERLESQQDYRFFPVSLEFMASKKVYHHLEVNSIITIDDIIVKTTELNHPGKSFSFRVEHGGKSFVYASDGEYNNLPNSKIAGYINFFREADFLVFDAPYSFSEEMEKINWGHSSALVGIDLSAKAKIKTIALFHHAPENDDSAVFNLLETAINYRKQNYPNANLNILLAREGLEIRI
ncbi:MAG: MBL fold metallo-hydrolase [Ignavibacteria bacterium]|nr:MBL fold metallo-hydrolase [Ignavibacteria bacterium]